MWRFCMGAQGAFTAKNGGFRCPARAQSRRTRSASPRASAWCRAHMTDRAWVPGAMPDSPGDGTGGRGFDGSMDAPWQSPAYALGLRL